MKVHLWKKSVRSSKRIELSQSKLTTQILKSSSSSSISIDGLGGGFGGGEGGSPLDILDDRLDSTVGEWITRRRGTETFVAPSDKAGGAALR